MAVRLAAKRGEDHGSNYQLNLIKVCVKKRIIPPLSKTDKFKCHCH